MAKSEVEELTDKTIAKGGILVKLYFDMQSENKDELQPLMTTLVNESLLKTPGVVYCFGSIEEPIKNGDHYSTSAIVTTLVKDLKPLIYISFQLSPAGVEIIKPTHDYLLKSNEMQAMLLDLSQISLEYSQYILSRVLKPEEFEKLKSDIAHRTEIGKRFIKKEDEKSP